MQICCHNNLHTDATYDIKTASSLVIMFDSQTQVTWHEWNIYDIDLWPLYITGDLVNCFHQLRSRLSQMKFVKNTTITVSLSFLHSITR